MMVLIGVLQLTHSAAGAARRPLVAEDFYRLQDVESPACSSDGQWVAYTVTTSDRSADELKSAVWMVNWAGTERRRLTAEGESASAPQFSPDGRFLTFLAARTGEERLQLYLLDRRGGEATRLTNVVGEIGDYRWSPDGTRIVLSLTTPDGVVEEPAGVGGNVRSPQPIVINGLHFKEDRVGYVTEERLPRLFILDVASRRLAALTDDVRYGDDHPVWSPDGLRIAYTSSHAVDHELTGTQELYIVEARPGAPSRQLASFYSPNIQSLAWTTDGQRVAYMVGIEPKLYAYMHDRLAVVAVAGGTPFVATDGLDRAVSGLMTVGVADSVGVIVEDDVSQYPALVSLASGRVRRRILGPIGVTAQCYGGGHTAVLASTDARAPEIEALERGKLRPLSAHNEALLAELELGEVRDISFPSADGTDIHGLLTLPIGYVAGQRYPTVLWIHGGPNGQDQHGLPFDTYPVPLERQWFAAHGYAVLAVNYRGSSGRGSKFQRSIAADWGHLEVADLLASVDYAVKSGIADPARLGIGGWSYGGLLTNYTIATDTRFKAAISGAGSANQVGLFGTDEYAMQYLNELGVPATNADLWIKVSYPFFHADRIVTPTLFLGGDRDFNVPIAGAEQMYQSLRALGVPTQLVVYPGQYHLFTRPTFIADRIERFLAWYDHYLKAPAP